MPARISVEQTALDPSRILFSKRLCLTFLSVSVLLVFLLYEQFRTDVQQKSADVPDL